MFRMHDEVSSHTSQPQQSVGHLDSGAFPTRLMLAPLPENKLIGLSILLCQIRVIDKCGSWRRVRMSQT